VKFHEIGTAVRRYIREMGTDLVTGTIVKGAINDAASELNEFAECRRMDATVSIKSGAREMSLPTAMLDIYQVRLGTGSQRVKLNPASRSGLARDQGDFEGATSGTPSQYYTDGMNVGFHPKPRARSHWATGNAYSVGDLVIPSASDNGFIYKCNTAGTSSGTEPTWPTTISGTVSDGSAIVWQQAASTRVYIRALHDTPVMSSYATATPSWCPNRYHKTIGKLAAYNLESGLLADGDAQSVSTRMNKLYNEYLREANELKGLMNGRSKEYQPRIVPTGYGTYRR